MYIDSSIDCLMWNTRQSASDSNLQNEEYGCLCVYTCIYLCNTCLLNRVFFACKKVLKKGKWIKISEALKQNNVRGERDMVKKELLEREWSLFQLFAIRQSFYLTFAFFSEGKENLKIIPYVTVSFLITRKNHWSAWWYNLLI